MHLSQFLDIADDPSYDEYSVPSNWTIDIDPDEADDDKMEDVHHEELTYEQSLDLLIDKSLEKIHKLQTTYRRDELRRVLVVNTIHRLLMAKIDYIKRCQEEQQSSEEEEWAEGFGVSRPEPDAVQVLNKILQEKIGSLGFSRTVKISLDIPKKPGQVTTISATVKGAKGTSSNKKAAGERMSGERGNFQLPKKNFDDKHDPAPLNNAPSPTCRVSGREPALF